jgi:hypothetical protein
MCIRTKQLIAPGVEGFDRRRGVAIRDQAVNAPLHLFSGTLSKGERQDLLRLRTLLGDQPSHAASDYLGLSCALTGNNEKWTLTVRYSGVLLIV